MFKQEIINAHIESTELKIAVLRKEGPKTPLLFLHGFGSTKEDYADIMRHPDFKDREIIAYDAPGFGETECSDLDKVSIDFLVKTAMVVIRYYKLEKFHISGHSMGGLTALMLIHRERVNAISFTDIEGNVGPEDCFLSRQINEYPSDNPIQFFNDFIDRMRNLDGYSNSLYAANIKSKVKPDAIKPIFKSMVELSDHGDLMAKFLKLNCEKMFVYGEENRSLSYLKYLEENNVRLSEISSSSHFPMYSNPPALWKSISEFISTTEDNTHE